MARLPPISSGRVNQLLEEPWRIANAQRRTPRGCGGDFRSLPWGPRLFGQVDYPIQWAIVLGVWALQLIWSPLWLSRFTMGPFEWLWRRLSYGRDLPLRRTA